jgi:hypothetical protein
VNVGGGLSPSDFFGTGTPGQPGIITIVQVPEPVASGPLLLMMAVLFRDFRRGGRRDMH